MKEIFYIAVNNPPELLIIGVLFLVGAFAHGIGHFAHVPRVTVLLLLGIIAGPSVFSIIPPDVEQWFPLITHIALAMVGFLLGESFVGREIKESGPIVLIVSIGETLGAALIVFTVYFWFRVTWSWHCYWQVLHQHLPLPQHSM